MYARVLAKRQGTYIRNRFLCAGTVILVRRFCGSGSWEEEVGKGERGRKVETKRGYSRDLARVFGCCFFCLR